MENSELDALYESFNDINWNNPEQRKADKLKRKLLRQLDRKKRSQLLQIIDLKDLMLEDTSKDSFIRGFQLAMNICSELKQYGGYPFD